MSNTTVVAPAEHNDGIKALAAAIAKHWREQRQAQDKADAHGLEMGRLICEHAARPEVQAAVAIENAKKSGGRPKVVHCFVAEQIRAAMSDGPSQRHLERCARAFLKAKAKGLPLTTSIKIAEASAIIDKVADKTDADGKRLPVSDLQPSPERLFNTESESTETDDAKVPPEKRGLQLAEEIIRKSKLDETVNPGVVRGLLKGLSPILEQHGFTVMPQKRK